MSEPKDPRPLEPRQYWEDEPEEPACRFCGVELRTPNEERKGLCDACYETEQEEEEDQP